MDNNSLYRLNRSDTEKALDILSDAFLDYPFPGSLIKNREKRKIVLKELFRIEYKRALKCGQIIALSEDFKEVSIWKNTISKPSMFSYYCIYSSFSSIKILTETTKDELNSIKDADNKIMDIKKSLNLPLNTAELYVIGVANEFQGQGRASKLLQAVIDYYESIGKGILIMTNTESNTSFYQKIGFKVIKDFYDENNNIQSYFLYR